MKKSTVNWVQGSTPFLTKKIQIKYCRRCGQPLLQYCSGGDDQIDPMVMEQSMLLGVCTKCYPREIEEITKELAKNPVQAGPTDEEKKITEDKYEQAIKKYAEELRSRKYGSDTSADI